MIQVLGVICFIYILYVYSAFGTCISVFYGSLWHAASCPFMVSSVHCTQTDQTADCKAGAENSKINRNISEILIFVSHVYSLVGILFCFVLFFN